jgi:hypothetical protein
LFKQGQGFEQQHARHVVVYDCRYEENDPECAVDNVEALDFCAANGQCQPKQGRQDEVLRYGCAELVKQKN